PSSPAPCPASSSERGSHTRFRNGRCEPFSPSSSSGWAFPSPGQEPSVMSRLVEPHGGTLVDRFVPAEEVEGLRHRAESLPQITLDARELADLELIATGAASPLV